MRQYIPHTPDPDSKKFALESLDATPARTPRPTYDIALVSKKCENFRVEKIAKIFAIFRIFFDAHSDPGRRGPHGGVVREDT